jgi:predicted ATPase
MFRSILLDVLANFAASTDDKSQASGITGITSQSFSLQSLSCRSQGSSTAMSLSKSEELLKVLCKEVNAPVGFVDHVLLHLSGKGSSKPPAGKAPSMKAMVSFMERAFRRCTQETKLVVVALDDVQYIDEMTWKILRQVFEGCNNVLMVCAFDLSRSRDLKVEADFWQVLNQKYRPSGHFVPMELSGLGKEEITVMTMKTLGLQREEIPPDLLNEILIQSGGMPHFANEFLELVKRRQFNEMMDGRIADNSGLGSVPEIILHRIDSFDVAVRNVLNVAAVLGKSFTLKEVIAVLLESHDMRQDILEKEAASSLGMAVMEGILRQEEAPDDGGGEGEEDESEARDYKDKPKTTVYSFYHSIWQTTILSLMLDARKRDVHSKIATSMEKGMSKDGSSFEFQMKLLGHWKNSGNTSKLTNLALDVGKRFEQKLGMPTQSIRVYEEALDAWKGKDDDDKPPEEVGGKLDLGIYSFCSSKLKGSHFLSMQQQGYASIN